MGTVGGNIANGSPIGDTPPALIALGATVTLAGRGRRTVPLETSSSPTASRTGSRASSSRRSSSRGRRRDAERGLQDHQAAGRGHLRRRLRPAGGGRGGVVRSARIAFGGMAATPKRAQGRGGAGGPALDGADHRRGARRRWPRTSRRSATGGRRRPIARRWRGGCCSGSSSRARASRRGWWGGGVMGVIESDATIRGACTRRSGTTPRTSTSPAQAEYTDDIAEPAGTLHAYLGLSDRAHAEIVSMDLDAVRAAPGVVGVLMAADVPAKRREPGGQARRPGLRRDQGRVPWPADLRGRSPRRATRRGGRRRSPRSSIATCRTCTDVGGGDGRRVSVRDRAAEARARRGRRRRWRRRRGGSKGGCGSAGRTISTWRGMIAFAVPGEDDEVTVYSSTQHPSEVQHMVAHVLGRAVERGDGRSCGAWAAASAARRRRPTSSRRWRRWRRRSRAGR